MKKVLIGLLALLLVISGICFYNADSSEVLAATGDVTTGDGFIAVEYDDLKDYRKSSGNVAPTAPSAYKSYIFAGWYQDAACQKVYKDVSADTTLAYAKFVPANVLSVKVQLKSGTTDKSESTNMRLVSSVDGTNYQEVGFEIYFDGATTPITTRSTKVYKRVVANAESGVDYNYSAKVVDVESKYFVTATLLNIKNTEEKPNFEKPFHIKPFWTTMDGTIVYGVSKYVTVNDGLDDDNINIPVRVGSGFNEDTAQVQVAGKEPANASVAYYDGTYAHLNIDVTNRASVLKSLSVINVTDGTIGGSAEYRNLDTKYDGTEASIDTSWYDVKGTNKKKYVIATSADLYGLANLVNAPTYYFGNQTIYVIADIEVNKGRATESGWSTYEEDGTTPIEGATSHIWTPIGYEGKNFQGTFDGQGHTISGLNGTPTSTASEAYLGLFGAVGTKSLQGKLMNFRVTNSYFEERTTGTNYTGGVVGRINGNVDSVYSDAYIKAYTILTGGITGRVGVNSDATGEKQITNCCYDGTITLDGNSATYGGGIVGQQFSGTLTMRDCLFSGDIKFVNRTTAGEVNVGGLCGRVATSITMENCLNSGETSLVGSTVSLTAIGRVIGLITNSTDITVDAKNVYYTNKGIGTSKWYAGANPVIKEVPVEIAESDITGNCAYFNKILDYSNAGAWALVPANSETGVAEGTPVLKSFADIVGVKPALPEVKGNIDWYTGLEQPSFTICDNEDNQANVEDLKGFSYLVNEGISFKDRTVTMEKDVTVNDGTVDTWDTANETGLDKWTPIGTTEKEFAGTFDGGMNTIQGIYVNTNEKGVGLFGSTGKGSAIQNLKLTNSYINTTTGYAGSIVGSASGSLTNVYSDAIVKVTAPAATKIGAAGGLVAEMNGTGTMDLRNCWFAGSVTNTYASTGGIVGIVAQGKVNMVNCLNTGELTGATNSVGGLCSRTFRSTEKLTMNGTTVSTLELHMTNCLNTGKILSSVGWTGSIIGKIQHLTKGMTCTNVYTTNESYAVSGVATPIGSGSLDAASAPISKVGAEDITGLRSYYNNILVKTEEWVPTETTPALKTFTDGLLTESTTDINIDWFEGFGTTEYIICDEDTNEENVAELKGFAYLANYGIDFAGMTVTLANDVTLNEETLSELTEEQRAELDVWTPVGTTDNKFAGTFDGDMHTIYGLYINTDEKGVALFRGTSSVSTIKNLKIKNAYIQTSNQYAGTFVGSTSGNLENLYSNADIVTTNSYAGGIVGQTWTSAGNDITISKCWFDGTIDGSSNIGGILAIGSKGNVELKDCLNTGDITYSTNTSKPSLKWVGGLVGRTLRSSKEWTVTEDTTATMTFKMTNCLNAGELTDSNDKRVGSALGQNNGPNVKFTNVYTTEESYKYDGQSTSVGRNNGGNVVEYGGIILVAENDITSELAYYNKVLVNEADSAWSLTTGVPVLTIFVDEATAIETPILDENLDISWYNGLKSTTHNVCTSDDNVENVKQFYGFAYLVNHGVNFDNMNVMLDNDLTVNESAVSTWNMSTKEGLTLWTPIGTDTLGFAGTFDGQMNTISGICIQVGVQGAGLFRNTSHGSTLKNFKLVNSYVDSTKTSSSIVGSVVGSCGGNLINVYSNSFVRAAGAYIGGIAGQIFGSGDVSIDGCCFAGTILNKTGSSNAGGIAGVITSGNITMENCLNAGNITVAGDSVGGFFGRSFTAADRWTLSGIGSATLTIKNCLNTGAIKGNASVGSIIGWKQRGTVNIGDAVYGTKTSTETKSSGAVNNKLIGKGSVNSGQATLVEITNIKGAFAQNELEGLDFSETGKWALINGSTPQLRAFADETKLLSGDFSWYSADSDEYTIDTAEELIGFSSLANYGTTYSGKTIKLGENIDLNEGWTASANAEAPEVEWKPVGMENAPFSGTFNGQGKSISGVYVASTDKYMGLFGVTEESSEVKNLRLLNSYFEQQVNSPDDKEEVDGFVGSIAGWLNGDMTNVYSNAIVKSGNRYTGGLVSQVSSIKRTDVSKPINITNCWFDGQIITGTYGRYIGGIAAGILNGTCNMENVLFTGTIDASYNGSKAIYLGGITGEVKAIAKALNLTSVVAAGKIVGNHTSNQCNAVVGRVRIDKIYDNNTVKASAANPHLDMENVFATRDCYASTHGIDTTVYTGTKIITEAVTDEVGNVITPAVTEEITAKVTVIGTVERTNGDNRLIGFAPNQTLADAWVIRTDGVPIPKTLADVVGDKVSNADATALAKEIGLDYWNSSAKITDVEDYGAGNYLITYTTTDSLTYAKYLEKLEMLDFVRYADNTSSDMDDDGVHQATYKKDSPEWILNVTWVENESKIYISINTDKKSLDDNLVSAVQTEGEAITLSMLEIANGELDVNGKEVDQYGNSFVFELPNGHFIVSDGGRAGDGLKLIEYLRGLVGTTDGVQNPIYIDAWIITHYHGDHCGALTIFNDEPAYRGSVYVDAIYVSEPSSYAATYWEADRVTVINNVYKGISYLTKEDGITRPEIYQMHMGQRYYFNGITMDVLDTQEQHPVATWADTNGKLPDPFNTSSTSCVFSFADGNDATKKVFMGGDATNVNLTYMMMAYGEGNKTLANIDVFVALHHGHNTTAVYESGEDSWGHEYKGKANTNWADFLLNNENNTDQKFDAVLFPYYEVYELNWEWGSGYVDNIGSKAYPYNIGEMNRYLYEEGHATMHYTYGNGTVQLTFGTTIEATVLDSWK